MALGKVLIASYLWRRSRLVTGTRMVELDGAVLQKLVSELETARERAGRHDRWRLNEPEVYALLDMVGLAHGPALWLPPNADAAECASWAEGAVAMAGRDGRLLVKVVGREILHKSDAGGVTIVRLADAADPAAAVRGVAEDVLAAVAAAGHGADCEGVLACGFVPHGANTPGQELLLSLRQDPAFGPVVVVGVGGTLTEWYGRGTGGRSTVVFPARALDRRVVAETIEAHPLLALVCRPSRLYATPPVATADLVAAVVAVAGLGAALAADAGADVTLEELEINPLVASGGTLVALDGVGLAARPPVLPVARPLGKIGPLLAPRSAVVMGVSARGSNPGRIILDNLRRSAGPVRERLWVVHPKETEIDGVPCVPSCAALPQKCDLAVVAIPADGARDAISELVKTDRAESIILIPGGFAEAGHADLAAEIEQVLADAHAARGGGPVLVGGNCLGIVSRDQYNTFFLPLSKLPFQPGRGENLAIVSQSGAYLVTFASNYDGLVYPRASISYGNQMDLTVSDFLWHFVDVPEVTVVACYIEGFRPGDGARFLAAIRAARARGKQVVVFKAGKTALGAKAAASHTASLAGDYAVARACLHAAGATVAESLDEFEDFIKIFTLLAGRPVRGRRVGVLSNAGFECSTVTDALGELELATFDPATRARLDACLPPFAHRDNPVDATPMTATPAYAAATAAILDCPDVDVAILSAVPATPALDTLAAGPGHDEDVEGDASLATAWIRAFDASEKPAVCVVDSGRIYDPLCRRLESAGVPVFRKIDRAARALAAVCAATDR